MSNAVNALIGQFWQKEIGDEKAHALDWVKQEGRQGVP